MPASLHPGELAAAESNLRQANEAFARRYPGEGPARQPVHTVYGGAQLFRSDSTGKLGQVARRALAEYAPDAETLAQALGYAGGAFAGRVYQRVVEKLEREPVEDFRIDFEDGYGNRPDAEEDGHAESVAREVAAGLAAGTLPPFLGIRVKTLSEELRGRSIRTLDLFLTTLVQATGGALPSNFVVTLPKVALPEQVAFFTTALAALEPKLGLPAGALRFELMVEVPQAIIGAGGRCMLPELVAAGEGRVTAAHFGTYDYTAGVGITAAHQHMRHAACDYAKHAMQVSLAGTGVWLSDGSTTVMPVPVHRAAAGESLSPQQQAENRASVHRAWRLHYDDVRHSLVNGFYQGWDLHPAQIPTRYAAVFAFFLESVESAGTRLKNFVEKAAQATLVGDVFDDAATGQGLLNYFIRGMNCGALTEREALEMTGLTVDELRGRSFLKILNGRRLLG
jgi:citrate lyase beta subunit